MEKSYLVSARKYRPRRFDELVAQSHVTETLKNAIKLDRLAHAYLFSGPRGVGKTTAARILAKAINCNTPLSDRPDAEPCLECDSCKSFDGGRNLNVIEIDAASNNKVDDMRELRDTVRIPPQGASKKVYIVDEVHMLSQAAFNALLKTLEEPPPYALFIFATTEPHKVLPTIQSRCQRFDFRRIDVEVIVDHLKHIAEQEGVAADEASYMLLARKGDGALRDALSAFDQAVSLCGQDIVYADLANAFRVVDLDRYFDITRCAADRDSAHVLSIVDALVKEGYDLTEFLGGLLGHLRNMLVAVSTNSTALIEATPEVRERYQAGGRSWTESDLLRMMMVVSDTEESLKVSRQPRLNVELGLLKLVHLGRVADLTSLIGELKSMDPSQFVARKPARPDHDQPERERSTATGAQAKPEPAQAKPEPAQAKPELAQAKPEPQAKPGPQKAEVTERAEKPLSKKSRPAPPASEEAGTNAAPIQAPAEAAPSLFGKPALKATPRKPSVEGSAAVAISTEPTTDRSAVKHVDNIWLAFVRSVKSDRIHVGSLLQHGAPARIIGSTLHVSVPDDFHKRLLTNQEAFLLDHIQSHLPDELTAMVFDIKEEIVTDSGETEETFDPLEYMNKKRAESPVVRAIFDEFGGELVW